MKIRLVLFLLLTSLLKFADRISLTMTMHFIPTNSYWNKLILFLRCIGYQNCRQVYRLNEQAKRLQV